MSEQEQIDQALARRMMQIAGELLSNGAEATAGLSTLLREIHHRHPRLMDRISAETTLARLPHRTASNLHA